jgi:hypothetical protein
MQGSDPTGYPGAGLTPRIAPQLQQGGAGPYASLSWDEMMRSLSDPLFNTGQGVLPAVGTPPSGRPSNPAEIGD